MKGPGFIKIHRPMFEVALADLHKRFTELSPDEMKITKMDAFNFDKYMHAMDLTKESDEKATENCRNIIERIEEDLVNHRKEQKWIAYAITSSVPKILVRFDRLDQKWQGYIIKRIDLDDDERTLYEFLAVAANQAAAEQESADRDEARRAIELLDQLIKEVEDALDEYK